MLSPLDEAMALKPVTAISLPMMMTAIQAGTDPPLHETDQGGSDQEFVGDGVEELAEDRDHLLPPGQESVDAYRSGRRGGKW